MEENRAHIIQVAVQCEETPPGLVVPDLDLVVITAGHEQGLRRVEVNASDRTIMFFESIDECSHAVIPQLDSGGVKRDEDPWPGR